MNRFNKKTAIFYFTTIVFVLILFKIITTYGENNLKAPSFIAGTYKVQIEPQANCPNPEKLLLVLQQSGIYVGATILPDVPAAATSVEYIKSFPFNGKLQEQKLKLTGAINNLEICRSLPSTISDYKQKEYTSNIQIQGQFIGGSLQGQIILNSNSESLKFIARSQPSIKS